MFAQYFTPPQIAAFVWEIATGFSDVGNRGRALDPAAGDGAFLKAALASNVLQPACLHGVEVDLELATRMAASLGGVHVHCGNGLMYEGDGEWRDSFDVVIGNPPFGRLQSRWKADGTLAGKPEITDGFVVPNFLGGKAVKTPVELLFLERSIQLAKPDGIVALIMPQGFFANQRLQKMRDWTLEQAHLLAVFDLPDEVFRRSGLHARTGILVLRKRGEVEAPSSALLFAATPGQALEQFLAKGRQAVSLHVDDRQLTGIQNARSLTPAKICGDRWDAAYWKGRRDVRVQNSVWPVVFLGDFITHLTYGPIITGKKPNHFPGGVPVIYQRNIEHTGVRLKDPLCVCPDSEFDPSRSRVSKGDLLFPRSGVGTLGQNRMAVYCDHARANVGCFVDIIRLEGINPFYVWFYFKTDDGFSQIDSVINGVGTPNINFGEIRALRITLMPDEFQRQVEAEYLEMVLPLHNSRGGSANAAECKRKFRSIVEQVSVWLD